MDLKSLVPQSIRNYYHFMQSLLANIRWGFPASDLKIIGVTGTDGKTTTCTMIYEILKKAGYKVGLITSVSAKIGKREFDTGFHVTTPDPDDVPKFLRMMVEAGIKWVVLEVTSHALDQNRVANISFEKAVFTNITSEHLDYHKSWKRLARAKAELINLVNEGGDITFKIDERGGKFIERKISESSNVLIKNVCSDELVKKKEATREGLHFSYEIKRKEVEVFIPILGEYNISNAQCAMKTCESLTSREIIIEALAEFKGVKGRMQVVRRKRPCNVIVDFAHTSNALMSTLSTVAMLKGKGKCIVVFGCAGLRDFYKREKMGRFAAKLADVIIITAEDPRTEKLTKINDQILQGALKAKGTLIKRFENRKSFRRSSIKKLIEKVHIAHEAAKKPTFVFDQESVKSREDAIELALKLASHEAMVIITGKAHEKSLCFGKVEYPWSDYDAVARAVRLRYGREKK